MQPRLPYGQTAYGDFMVRRGAHTNPRARVLSICARYETHTKRRSCGCTLTHVHRRCQYIHTCVRRSNILPGPGYVWHTLDIPRRRLDLKFIGRKFFGDRPIPRDEATQTLGGVASENDRVEMKLYAGNCVIYF